MVASLVLALLQSVSVRVGPDKKTADSVRAAMRRAAIEDSVDDRRGRRGPPIRAVVTPELERTAFRDPAARELLLRAREARLRQDSALLAYDATAYQRLSVGFGFRVIGRDRLLFRTENASRIRWSRGGGVSVDLKGQRAVFPMVQGIDDNDPDMNGGESPIPYYPGRDALWIGANNGIAKADVDEREMVHPIARGAEAYYRYATGDSITIELSDGKKFRLRELRIEPRRPEWKLSVGSFWFDVESGQLVRAAYRFSAEMDIWKVANEETQRAGEKKPEDEVPVWVKPMISPMKANLEAVTIEYGLFANRFWLPRSQAAEGSARVSFMRVPFRIEERFKYASVNGTDSVPPIPTPLIARKSWREIRDSLFGDSTRLRDLPLEERRARRKKLDEVSERRSAEAKARRDEECRTSGTHTRVENRENGAVRVMVRIPCDTTVLAHSSELPASIYDPGDELFGKAELAELTKSLDFGLQAAWAPQPPIIAYGLDYTRYNRVEGFSTGAAASSVLGKGYTARVEGRLGLADLSPNAEVSLSRSNGRRQLQADVYRRLAVANDWGSPLSFGSSFSALMFGRDEGFYYRAWGAELTEGEERGGGMTWRLFAERETNADVETRWSLAKAVNNIELIDNIQARPVTIAGAGARHVGSWGLDPQGWRLLSDLRLEAAATKYSRTALYPTDEGSGYARGALDLTVSHGLGRSLTGAITAGGGTIGGTAPTQRLFYLGGTQTVRGQYATPVGAGSVGDTYWLTRAELGSSFAAARPVVFGDLGWAGRREDFSHPGQPLSGVGVGASFLDGLFRLDVARGLHPSKGTRVDLYLESRF